MPRGTGSCSERVGRWDGAQRGDSDEDLEVEWQSGGARVERRSNQEAPELENPRLRRRPCAG